MDSLGTYLLPIRRLKTGIHHFSFQLDDDFFQAFPDTPIQKGEVRVDIVLEKRASHYVFDFIFTGSVRAECDRCLAPIDLPIESEEQLIVKVRKGGEPGEEDFDVAFVNPEDQDIQLAPFFYEYVVLAVPIVKVIDCDPESPDAPCDQSMLKHLEHSDVDTGGSALADQLKDLFPDN